MDETVDTRDEEDQGDASPVGEIVDWVARGIIEGRLQPGDDLNSVDLAKRFNVSRTPVREALFVLNRERLLFMQKLVREEVQRLEDSSG